MADSLPLNQQKKNIPLDKNPFQQQYDFIIMITLPAQANWQ